MWDKNFPQNITLGKVASIWKLLKSDQSQANQLYGNPKKVLKFTYYCVVGLKQVILCRKKDNGFTNNWTLLYVNQICLRRCGPEAER